MKSRLSFAFIACSITSIFVLAAAPWRLKPPKDEPFSGAFQSAVFRSDKRVSEDGKIPHNALMDAVGQRQALLDPTDGAGAWPGGWTYHGPTNVGGRVRGILIHPTNTQIMWTGGCSGGMWKTTDGGANWTQLDDFMSVLPIGCMALSPSNPDVLYVGTGEGFFETVEGSSNTAAVRGAGIFKSIDGGLTWNQLPSTTSPNWYFVNRLAIDPNNASIILAATGSGIYRSTNGGTTWTQTSTTFMYDLRFHPTDSNKLIAGSHDAGVFYSTNGGLTWTASTGDNDRHRSEVRYHKANPNIVYLAAADNSLIYTSKSTDGGATFVQTAAAGISCYQAYNVVLWVSPTNPDHLVIGGVFLHRSLNGGASFTQTYNNVHADMHEIVDDPGFNGTTNLRIFFGTDGGIYRANNYTQSAVTALNTGLGITQFYGAVMNPANNRILGGTQDNGTKFVNPPSTAWSNTFGGDGGYCDFDPTDTNYWYGEIYYAQMFRSTNGGSSASYVYSGIADAGSSATCNFIPYFMLDPNNPNTLLMGARSLWRSTNIKAATPTWTAIKSTIQPRPAPQTGGIRESHMNGNPPWNISTLAVAKGNGNIIWVGHNNGEVWKTTNGLAAAPTWNRVDSGMPARWVGSIAIDPSNHNRVFVSYMGYESNNLWLTNNGGTTWAERSGTLPSAPISAIAIHPTKPNWVYAGTDVGLFTSSDAGDTWSTSNQGPGIVPVEELRWVTNTKLLCVTHGRGIYTADVIGNDQPLVPDSYTVEAGIQQSGRLSDLYSSDDRKVNILADLVSIDDQYPVRMTFTTKSPEEAPSSMVVRVESSSSINGLMGRISLLNHNTGLYEEIDARAPTIGDQVITINVPGDVSRFVNNSTYQITVRMTWEFWTVELGDPWVSSVDQVLITVQG